MGCRQTRQKHKENFCNIIGNFCQGVCKILKTSNSTERQNLNRIMQYKAFILHFILTCARMIVYISGKSQWDIWLEIQQNQDRNNDLIQNRTNYEPAEKDKHMVLTGKYIAWGLIVFGALIDFVSIKYPALARSLFHVEML